MKIVLTKNVENVGKGGDIKEVADGYAVNFLIPNGLAKPATESAIVEATETAEKNAKEAEAKLKNVQESAKKIDGQEIVIKSKSEKGKLFGAISQENILEELKAKDLDVKKNNILLGSPIKEVGEYPVKIRLEEGIEAEIKVIITEEE